MDQHKSGSVGAKSGSSIRKFLPRSPKNENQPLTLPSAAPNTTQEGPSYTQACAGIPRRMVRARGGLTGLGHLKVVCPGHRGVPLLSENIQLNYPHFWQYIIYKIIYIYSPTYQTVHRCIGRTFDGELIGKLPRNIMAKQGIFLPQPSKIMERLKTGIVQFGKRLLDRWLES